MKTRFFLYAFSLVKYLITGSDVADFYHKFHSEIEPPIFISLAIFAITLEIFASSPEVLKSISMKYRRRMQFSIHIALAVNSLIWMIYEVKSVFNIVFFLIALAINFFIVHKILHAIQKENEESKKEQEELA